MTPGCAEKANNIMTKYKFLAVLFFLIFFCGVASLSAYAENDFLSSINAHLERLESRYQISFKYKDFPRHTDYLKFSEVSVDEYHFLNEYLSLFEEEINKYPSGFFKDRNVRGIGLVTHLFMGQRSAQGLYGTKVSVMFFDIARRNFLEIGILKVFCILFFFLYC